MALKKRVTGKPYKWIHFTLLIYLAYKGPATCGCLRPIPPEKTRLGDRFDGGTNGDGGELVGHSTWSWREKWYSKGEEQKRNPQRKMMKVPKFMYFRYFSLFLLLDYICLERGRLKIVVKID